MKHDFSHILLSLRKERKLTQKQAAKDLDISPALLSHYEKGVRECGLQFVVRAADYYHVSCDYLLGRTTDRSGMAPELVSPHGHHHDKPLALTAHDDQRQKQILQSVHILFKMLEACDNEQLTEETSHAISVLIYTLFRALFGHQQPVRGRMFALPAEQAFTLSSAAIHRAIARTGIMARGGAVQEQPGVDADNIPYLSEDQLRQDFPFFMTSLSRLFREAETTIMDIQ